MQRILILGAGLSTTSLIRYLLKNAAIFGWKLRIGDISEEIARKKAAGHPNAEAVKFDVTNDIQRAFEVENADIVISMLPSTMHFKVALECIRFRKNMITASYISRELNTLANQAKEKNILILNEMGVDPGIDHMSSMQIIDRIRKNGGKINVFESHTGGLIAPKHDNNPWNYKFTWNPRNVVLAGQGGARFLHNGRFKYIPYHKIFRRYERLYILNLGEFESYPNRDSLKYQKTYGLEDVSTMFRGTIRRPGYCRAWDILVQIGATDDSYLVENSENMTYRQFINSFLAYHPEKRVEDKLAEYTGVPEDSEIMYKLRWMGLFSENIIGLQRVSPAQILQHLLQNKWQMDQDDKDMIVMQHQFEYEIENRKKRLLSSLVFTGKDNEETAMSMTVGLPVAIACKLVLTGRIKLSGLQMPIRPEIYEPVLKELAEHGIQFIEEEAEVKDGSL